jgi:hypothetical protein
MMIQAWHYQDRLGLCGERQRICKHTLIDYCESMRKPQAMTVEVFVQRLKTLARYVGALPHLDPINAPLLNDEHIKYIVYKAMPAQWQVQVVQNTLGLP